MMDWSVLKAIVYATPVLSEMDLVVRVVCVVAAIIKKNPGVFD